MRLKNFFRLSLLISAVCLLMGGLDGCAAQEKGQTAGTQPLTTAAGNGKEGRQLKIKAPQFTWSMQLAPSCLGGGHDYWKGMAEVADLQQDGATKALAQALTERIEPGGVELVCSGGDLKGGAQVSVWVVKPPRGGDWTTRFGPDGSSFLWEMYAKGIERENPGAKAVLVRTKALTTGELPAYQATFQSDPPGGRRILVVVHTIVLKTAELHNFRFTLYGAGLDDLPKDFSDMLASVRYDLEVSR